MSARSSQRWTVVGRWLLPAPAAQVLRLGFPYFRRGPYLGEAHLPSLGVGGVIVRRESREVIHMHARPSLHAWEVLQAALRIVVVGSAGGASRRACIGLYVLSGCTQLKGWPQGLASGSMLKGSMSLLSRPRRTRVLRVPQRHKVEGV